jgi:hypothetical protein
VTRFRRVLKWALLALLFSPVALLFAANAFLNVGLEPLLNQNPEKLRIRTSYAWMWWPGSLDVWGLECRGQGKNDQWLLEVDHAHAKVDIEALFDREFKATDLVCQGGSFRYRFRADAPVDPALDATPPIKGLTNPPNPIPTGKKSPKGPWKITLVNADVEDVRELWLEDYRYVGMGHVHGDLVLADEISTGGKFEMPGGQLLRGEKAMLDTLQGAIEGSLGGIIRGQPITEEVIGGLDARAKVTAKAKDLTFLDFYLGKAPWLNLAGAVDIDMDVTVEDGHYELGSVLDAHTTDLAVTFFAYEIHGDGRARLEVAEGVDGDETRMSVQYGDFKIGEIGQEPFVLGQGFQLSAVSPDTRLGKGASSLNVVVDIPESQIPDVKKFDRMLPTGVGLTILGGTGTLSGHCEASTADATLAGVVDIGGDDVGVTMDGLVLTTDLALHAQLTGGDIGSGVYDFSGTELSFTNLGVRDLDPEKKRDEEDIPRGWWAKVKIAEGMAYIGQPTYLDTRITLACADSAPFVKIAAKQKSLPGWVQNALDVPDVRGSSRIKLAADSITVNPFYVSGGQLEVQLRWFRKNTANQGALFARYGQLSVAVDIDPKDTDIHVWDAKDWFVGENSAQGDKQDEKEEAKDAKAEAKEEARQATKQAKSDAKDDEEKSEKKAAK